MIPDSEREFLLKGETRTVSQHEVDGFFAGREDESSFEAVPTCDRLIRIFVAELAKSSDSQRPKIGRFCIFRYTIYEIRLSRSRLSEPAPADVPF